jgi:hypothetical protein
VDDALDGYATSMTLRTALLVVALILGVFAVLGLLDVIALNWIVFAVLALAAAVLALVLDRV